MGVPEDPKEAVTEPSTEAEQPEAQEQLQGEQPVEQQPQEQGEENADNMEQHDVPPTPANEGKVIYFGSKMSYLWMQRDKGSRNFNETAFRLHVCPKVPS